jgi:hypothetical protein
MSRTQPACAIWFAASLGTAGYRFPENQSEVLRVWDGINAEQQGRSSTIHIDIAQDLLGKLIQMPGSGPAGPRRVLRRLPDVNFTTIAELLSTLVMAPDDRR